jgi:hypothetical protein
MAFKSVNEIEKFDYKDCEITSFVLDENEIRMELKALIIEPENSQNERSQRSYADTVNLTLKDAHLEKGVQEGYKLYDADGNLKEAVPERILTEQELGAFRSVAENSYLYDFQKISEDDGRFCYAAGIEKKPENPQDLAEITDTYQLRISFTEAEFVWDKYMSRAE